MKGLAWFGVGLVLLMIVGIGINSYEINRDIESWKSRAEVSSDAEDMLQYMGHVKSGMEARGMTSGYAALILTTPENDMSLIYEAVTDHIENLNFATTEMEPGTEEFEQRVDRIQDSIGDLELHSFDFWSAHQGLMFWIVGFVGILMAFFGFMSNPY